MAHAAFMMTIDGMWRCNEWSPEVNLTDGVVLLLLDLAGQCSDRRSSADTPPDCISLVDQVGLHSHAELAMRVEMGGWPGGAVRAACVNRSAGNNRRC